MPKKKADGQARQARPRTKRGRGESGPTPPGAGRNGAAAPAPSTWSCATAATGKAEATTYLWDRRIADGSVCLLSGDQSAGKSTLCATLAAAVTTAGDGPGLAVEQAGTVLWMGAEEDPRREIAPRLFAAGCERSRVIYPEWSHDWTPRRLFLPRHADILRSLAKLHGARLIILDPISSHVESGISSETGTHVRTVIESLASVCRDCRCSAVMVRHPRKGAQGLLIERVSGSREWIAVPRTVIYLTAPDPESNRRVLVTLKPAPPQRPPALACVIVGREGSSAIEWEGLTDFGEDEAGAAADSPADRSALAEAMLFLKDHLGEDKQKSTDLLRWAQEAGLSWGTVQRAKVRLRIKPDHERQGESWSWYWSKPDGGWPQ